MGESGAGARNIALRKRFTLFISNEDIDNFNRIVKSLENSGLLNDCVTETVRDERAK